MWWVKVVYGGWWWLCVFIFKLGAQVCANYECGENVTLKLLILGLFIGQGLGFKGAYLDPDPTRVGV